MASPPRADPPSEAVLRLQRILPPAAGAVGDVSARGWTGAGSAATYAAGDEGVARQGPAAARSRSGSPRAGRPAWSRRFFGQVTDRLPVTVRAGAVGMSRPAALGLVLAAVLAAVLVVLMWRLQRPAVTAAPPRTLSATSPEPVSSAPSAPGAAPAASAAAGSQGAVVVDVAGRVRHPGVVDLRAGARVVDALRAAGGPLPNADLRTLNLARRLVDGEQILLLGAGETPPPALAAAGDAPSSAGGLAGAAKQPLNLNTATVQDFDGLPGVGPVLAQRIVDWRTAHGRFSTVDELQEVSGIGDSRFKDLKPLVTL